ncbi:MAG TPA: transposase, partial [Bacteroidales bacterium]|nr:transposase [Bacteroidales bacterium]
KRTLEPVYFALWMDGIVLKVRSDNKVINKCVYIVIGLKPDGMKEVLGKRSTCVVFLCHVYFDLKLIMFFE